MKHIIASFILGIIFTLLALSLVSLVNTGKEFPFSVFQNNAAYPSDSVKESQIHVYDNAVVIDVDGASLGSYASTGSMLPVLNENSNGIRIPVKSAEDIKIGDIITFQEGSDLIVHRVIEIGEDNEGDYFITKGDNNNVNDGKVRFEQVKYKTIGVLW